MLGFASQEERGLLCPPRKSASVAEEWTSGPNFVFVMLSSCS